MTNQHDEQTETDEHRDDDTNVTISQDEQPNVTPSLPNHDNSIGDVTDEQTETELESVLVKHNVYFWKQEGKTVHLSDKELRENFKHELAAWSRQQTARLFDEIYELSPTKQFKDWAPQDAVAFYERLKALEALRVGLEGKHGDSK